MITTGFLQDVAGYVDSQVEKVVINGSYEITSFEVKVVTGNTLALNYVVPAADVSVITLVELRDAANVVISSNTVNIPIAADHMMIHNIQVREGS